MSTLGKGFAIADRYDENRWKERFVASTPYDDGECVPDYEGKSTKNGNGGLLGIVRLATLLALLGAGLVYLSSQVEAGIEPILIGSFVCFFASLSFFSSWIHAASEGQSPSSAIKFLETIRRYIANDSLHRREEP